MQSEPIGPIPLQVTVDRSELWCRVLAPVGEVADPLEAIARIASGARLRLVLDLRHAGPPTSEDLRAIVKLLDRHGDRIELVRACRTVRSFLRLRGDAVIPVAKAAAPSSLGLDAVQAGRGPRAPGARSAPST